LLLKLEELLLSRGLLLEYGLVLLPLFSFWFPLLKLEELLLSRELLLEYGPFSGVERTYRIFDEQYEDFLNEVNQDE
jgi:hypothetical protein